MYFLQTHTYINKYDTSLSFYVTPQRSMFLNELVFLNIQNLGVVKRYIRRGRNPKALLLFFLKSRWDDSISLFGKVVKLFQFI